MLDKSNTGVIHQLDFVATLSGTFALPDDECHSIFEALDSNKKGKVNYSEFLAAMMTSRLDLNDQLLRQTFRRFAAANKKFITRDQLIKVTGNPMQAIDVMQAVHHVSRGQISYSEFVDDFRGPGKWNSVLWEYLSILPAAAYLWV